MWLKTLTHTPHFQCSIKINRVDENDRKERVNLVPKRNVRLRIIR